MRIIGLDYGSKRIGLALGDTETCLAGPLETLKQNKPNEWMEVLKTLIKTEQIEALVIGIPRPLADQTRETDQVAEIKNVIEKLKQEISIPIFEQNETWSSVEAARQAQEVGSKGKRDDLAAAIILQSWLDKY